MRSMKQFVFSKCIHFENAGHEIMLMLAYKGK